METRGQSNLYLREQGELQHGPLLSQHSPARPSNDVPPVSSKRQLKEVMANVTRYGEISGVNGYLRGQGELRMGPCHDKHYDGDRDDDDVSLLTFQLNPKLNHDVTRYSMVSRD